jgi:hypothetical protein
MAVGESAIGDLAAHDLGEGRVSIASGERIAEGGHKDEAAEVGGDS